MKIGSDCIYMGTRWDLFGQFVKIVGVVRGRETLTQETLDEGLQDTDIIEFTPYIEISGGRVTSLMIYDGTPRDFAEALQLPF